MKCLKFLNKVLADTRLNKMVEMKRTVFEIQMELRAASCVASSNLTIQDNFSLQCVHPWPDLEPEKEEGAGSSHAIARTS